MIIDVERASAALGKRVTSTATVWDASGTSSYLVAAQGKGSVFSIAEVIRAETV